MSASRFIKCVTVGDGAVGKTWQAMRIFSRSGCLNFTDLRLMCQLFLLGEELRKQIGTAAYIECNSKTQQNVKAVFDRHQGCSSTTKEEGYDDEETRRRLGCSVMNVMCGGGCVT
ncbi:hypothetical protein IFM89_008964 [Coptis chinensis]|uniref:Uncharacterized protein n=1 Tax=Coptis chinensis TaxID=261450 RepID=A0A835HUH2_9MAGN|nr:hypothetical protein IFM89_008964 [Coptis chinensis]